LNSKNCGSEEGEQQSQKGATAAGGGRGPPIWRRNGQKKMASKFRRKKCRTSGERRRDYSKLSQNKQDNKGYIRTIIGPRGSKVLRASAQGEGRVLATSIVTVEMRSGENSSAREWTFQEVNEMSRRRRTYHEEKNGKETFAYTLTEKNLSGTVSRGKRRAKLSRHGVGKASVTSCLGGLRGGTRNKAHARREILVNLEKALVQGQRVNTEPNHPANQLPLQPSVITQK